MGLSHPKGKGALAFVHHSYQSLVEGCWDWGEEVNSHVHLVCQSNILGETDSGAKERPQTSEALQRVTVGRCGETRVAGSCSRYNR